MSTPDGPEPDNIVTEVTSDKKPCPICGETIQATAKKCIHCGEFLEEDPRRVWRWLGWTGFKRKTLWDVLGLLIIPLALATVGVLFAKYQEDRQNDREDRQNTRAVEATEIRRAENDIATASQKGTDVAATEIRRAENDATVSALGTANYLATGTREAAETRTAEENAAAQSTLDFNRINEDILKSYFDDMSTLILETENITKVETIERARTLSTLSRLDGKRNGRILQFLQEAELINLIKQDLEGVNLSGADLGGADLREANLSGADLNVADLSGANLSEADLSEADLSVATLNVADLRGAKLFSADLRGAFLEGVDLRGAFLSGADLSGAILFRADLREAILFRVDLRGAFLSGADLREANLEGAEYNKDTSWPKDFDPGQAGAKLVE